MAPSAKHFPFLFFFALLSSSLHSHARESYFFNKATAAPAAATTTNNAKVEEAMPNKSNVQEQDPNFIPDTQSGYGLYGQNSEIESFEPYTTAASNNNDNNYYKNEAYVSDPQGMVSDTRFMDGRYTTTAAAKTTSGPPYTTTASSNNNNYYKNEAVNDPQGVSDTRFMDRSYTTTTANSGTPYTATNLPYKTESGESYPTTTINNDDNNNYYNKETYVSDPHEGMSHDTRFMDRGYTTSTAAASSNNYYNNGVGRNYNTKQQGMSDTRFLENGRYYYDINSEEIYRNGYQNSRRVNNHNNRGYYGNYNGNSMEGYQNQDDHFQESEAEEYVP